MGSGVVTETGDFGRVLLMPWHGRFMCPFVVAGLGLRYLRINLLLRLGHPLRNPLRTAFNSIKILGLHKDWWAKLMPLAQF
jgi:hypothetical protein